MEKKNHHAPELPKDISHWQTNFTQMKHKVMDYLRKHNPDHPHPIVDAHHYLILSNPHHAPNNTPLFCGKPPSQHAKPPPHHPTHPKDSPFVHHDAMTTERSKQFTPINRVSAQNMHPDHFQDENIRELPPIYSLQLEPVAKDKQNNKREATLKQKLEFYHRESDEKHQQQQRDVASRQRFKSIEVARRKEEEIIGKARASSLLKRGLGEYDRVKTSSQSEKKNIFFIPVAQYIRQHQQAINSTPIPPKKDIKKQHKILKIQEDPHRTPSQQENYTPSVNMDFPLLKLEENFMPAVPQTKKELHTGTHKRFYAHGKQHRHQSHVLQKEVLQKFEFAPWEPIRQQATIANLDQDTTDS